MKIDVLIMSSGRYEYLQTMLQTFHKYVNMKDHDVRFIIHEDLIEEKPNIKPEFLNDYNVEYHLTERNYGVVYAISNGWKLLRPDCDYVWHQEEDFDFITPIDVDDMIKVLDDPEINQVVLERNRFEAPMSIKHDFGAGEKTINGVTVTIVKNLFTNNPHLIKKSVIDDLITNQVKPTEHLLRLYFDSKNMRACFLGGALEPFKVVHTGHIRRGNYRDNL